MVADTNTTSVVPSPGPNTYTYTLFADQNPNTPSVLNAAVTIPTVTTSVTRTISGITYFTAGTQLDTTIDDIELLNGNVIKTGNISISLDDWSVSALTLTDTSFNTTSGTIVAPAGGDLNDYVKLNQDYSKLDESDLLYEYYKQTKPHLNQEEINFLMDDQFAFDEDVDEDIDIRRKKLALKEQVANAKSHLDGQKSTYYEEIKAGSKLTPEQQKAVNFFDRYNKESEVTQKTVKTNTDIFTQKTNNVFNDKFKGFEYNVGDKKYRFNVNNAEEVKNTQSDISNFTKKFLDKNSALTDAKGYHKSLYTAMNADAVAKHFYDQGKADAMKNSIAKAKNVDMNPRQAHGKIEAGGMKFKVLGDDSSDFNTYGVLLTVVNFLAKGITKPPLTRCACPLIAVCWLSSPAVNA